MAKIETAADAERVQATMDRAADALVAAVESIGRECADMAFEAGGGAGGPWGEVAMTFRPIGGDWDYLAEKLGAQPTREQMRAFGDAYEARLRALVEGE